MLPYLRLGPFLLQTSGLALLIGVWVGLSLSEREAKRAGVNSDAIYNVVFLGLVGGLVGARLGYAVSYLNAYLENPLSLFSLNPNTLSPSYGVLIGLLVAWIYGRRKELPLRPTLDILAPGLAAFMVFLGIAHLLNGDAFGAPTSLPWSIYLWNEYRHPSQIYEILGALLILMIVLRRPLEGQGTGMNFLLLAALTAGARLLLEAFRGDSLIWPSGFRAAQVVSLLIMLAVLVLMQELSYPPRDVESRLEIGE
jgi:phosphatidylglycerol:prolipoprotein diacylglycerol transferase